MSWTDYSNWVAHEKVTHLLAIMHSQAAYILQSVPPSAANTDIVEVLKDH
jgi:hypothetical protein